MSSAKNIPQWIHPFVSDKGTLAEIIKALEQQLVSLENVKGLIKREIQIETALSKSLDSMGVLLNYLRPEDMSDDDYREGMGFVVDTTATQTIATVESIVEWVTGYIPTIEEYPTYSDVGPGAMRIRLPLNKIQYAADVEAHVNRIKAAGVSLLVDHLDEFFEAFLESVLVDDYLFFALVTMFYDETLGWPILGGLSEWNFANWDISVWDSGTNPSDTLLIGILLEFVRLFDAVDLDDVLFFIGVLYQSESITPTDEGKVIDMNGFLSESITSFVDDIYGDIYQEEPFAEVLPNSGYAIIGTAKLDTDKIGFSVVTYTSYAGWDTQLWDQGSWDDVDMIYIIVTEAMT